MGLSKFESVLEHLGIERCGVSFEWLEANSSTCQLFDWLSGNLTEANLITPQLSAKYADIPQDEVLTYEELDKEFSKLNDCDVFKFDIETEYDVIEAEDQLKMLNEKIDLAESQLDSINENITRTTELSSNLAIDIEHFKNLRHQKLNILSSITQQCKEATDVLKIEKSNLAQLIKNENEKYILLGKYSENRIDEDDFEEYFHSIDRLDSFFRDCLNNSLKSTLKTTDDLNEDNETIDLVAINKCFEKMKVGIFNYMKVKGELAESEKLLELYYQFSNTDIALFENNEKLKTDLTEKKIKRIINSFIENCIANNLHGELKMKTISIRYFFEGLNVIESYILNLNECGKYIMLSLKTQNKKREELCAYFYRVVKSFISDNTSIQNRKKIIDDLHQCEILPYMVKEFLVFKDKLYNLLKFDEAVPLSNVFQYIDGEMIEINRLKDSILNDRILKTFTEYKEANNQLYPAKKFIWSGATIQPIMYNKRVALNLYEYELRNSSDSDKIKEAINIYKQILTVSNSDTLITPLKNNSSVSII